MLFRLVLASLIALITLPAQAQSTKGVFYDCNMTRQKDFEFWVSSKIGIVVLNDGKVVVSDRVTLAYGESIVYAQVTRNTATDLHIKWSLEGGLRRGEVLFPYAEYTAKLSKASKKLRVSGKLRGNRRSFFGRGQCTERVK